MQSFYIVFSDKRLYNVFKIKGVIIMSEKKSVFSKMLEQLENGELDLNAGIPDQKEVSEEFKEKYAEYQNNAADRYGSGKEDFE